MSLYRSLPKLNRVVVLLGDEQLEQLDTWARATGRPSRCDAVRELLRAGIAAKQKPDMEEVA